MKRRAVARAARGLGVVALLAAGGWFAWRAYETPLRAVARDYLALRRVDDLRDVLATAAAEARVDPALLAALMVAESGGRPSVVSNAGAMGLFQLTRTTADWRAMELGIPPPTDEELLSDPLLNARLGADNLAWLLDTFDGDERRALCAYNAGARKLKELCDAAGGWEAWRDLHTERRDSPILAYAERVLAVRDDLRARGTFAPAEAPRPIEGAGEPVGAGPPPPAGASATPAQEKSEREPPAPAEEPRDLESGAPATSDPPADGSRGAEVVSEPPRG